MQGDEILVLGVVAAKVYFLGIECSGTKIVLWGDGMWELDVNR